MSEEEEILNEANRDVILQLIEAGDDLSKARDIDFSVVFPDGKSAEAFASELQRQGYTISVEEMDAEEGLLWDVTVVKHMLPVCEAITAFQQSLESIASPLGGRNDGWGCIAQKPSSQH
jgi:regulator of RNase E activity RraB